MGHGDSIPSISVVQSGRKSPLIAWTSFALALGGLAGYLAGAGHFGKAGTHKSDPARQLEFYITERSFSEIENTKAKLEALCTQFVTGLPGLYTSINPDSSRTGANPDSSIDSAEHTLEMLDKAREQFRGTEPEGYLVQQTLIILKRLRQGHRWLYLYLPFLYEHPTHPLVGAFAKDAVDMSDLVGRQSEVAEAFDLVRRIPLASATRDRVIACLQKVGTAGTFAESEAGLPLATLNND
jgi:hypothetical protein